MKPNDEKDRPLIVLSDHNFARCSNGRYFVVQTATSHAITGSDITNACAKHGGIYRDWKIYNTKHGLWGISKSK